ncbi:hypothetical protein V8C86DRAFT_2729412 [Haematococcus lacustris]|nr:hypothetical protein QJQ45_009202 [Haematococcus lacustris]
MALSAKASAVRCQAAARPQRTCAVQPLRASSVKADAASRAEQRALMIAPISLSLAVTAHSAQAASEVAQIAASDNRPLLLATLLLPVVGWVAFNIFQPLLGQLQTMGSFAKDVSPDKRSVRINVKPKKK